MKPGRNDPCPCGSGKKYKKCCQDTAESTSPTTKHSGKGLAPTVAECNQLVALFNAGNHAELESHARLLLEQYPDSGFAWKALGATLQIQGKDSLLALQKTTELMPNDAEAHYNLGNTLKELGRLDEAEASYRRALQIKPDFAMAHSNLGNTLKELGRLDEAEASYRWALRINPDFAAAHYSLGFTLQELGRLYEAEASYRQAIEIKQDYAEAHRKLGLTLHGMGRLDEAEASLRRALQFKSVYADAHIDLGVLLGERELHKESVYHFQQAFAQRVGWHHEGDEDLSSGLIHAFIELTNKCNFHCDFCPSDSQQRTQGFMSLELIQQVCGELANKNLVKVLHLHLMGEPTLHPDFVEVLAYAASKKIKTELVTNGSTLNAKTIPKILDNLYGILAISLQTPTKETFKHRGDAGLSWERYIGNIRLLVREYLKRIALKQPCRSTLELRVMVTKDSKLPANIIESPEDIRAVMHEWRDFVANIESEFGLTPFNRKEHSLETLATQPSQAETKYPLQQGLSLSFWRGFTFANSMVGSAYSLEHNNTAVFCHSPFIEVGVLSNGDVTLCCLDYDGKLAVGNVKDNTIEAILNGKPTMDLRAAMLGRHPLPLYCQQCQANAVLASPLTPGVSL